MPVFGEPTDPTRTCTPTGVSTRRHPARVRFGLIALATVLLTAACGQASSTSKASVTSNTTPTTVRSAFHGVEPTPLPPRPRFVLTDTSGHRFDFFAMTQGHPTYLFFGYTHCPDDCPTAMADLRVMLTKIPADQREQVRVVMVTTDPKRDTGPVMRQFLNQFSTSFIGLYGTSAEVAVAQTASGLPVAQIGPDIPTVSGHPNEHVHKPGTPAHKHFGPLGYSVAHTSVIFAFNIHDQMPVLYPIGVTPADIAADVGLLLV